MAKRYTFEELVASFRVEDDGGAYALVDRARQGVTFADFDLVFGKAFFTLDEWAHMLHISRRTLERYRSHAQTFDTPQSERIMQIALLLQRGASVFGSYEAFHTWLAAENVAMGGVKPQFLLDNVFGIDLVKDTLLRIEHGVLA